MKKHDIGERFTLVSEKQKQTLEKKHTEFSEINLILRKLLSCNNSLIQHELQKKVEESTSKKLSKSTISRKLKNKIKFTRKRLCLIPQERNTAEKMDSRALYATEISRIPDCNLMFLDESEFNKHTRRAYG
ncbi:hypothetical protein H311_04712, partial [Anncaliia algerae PRA109]